MEWLGGFVLGFLADLLRSVFLPASTSWLNKFIPSEKIKIEVQENILTIEIMERLKALGKDPNLAFLIRTNSANFMKVLTSQKDAFVESSLEAIDSDLIRDQMEMNMEAIHRAVVAQYKMDRVIISLETSSWWEDTHREVFQTAQDRWKQYAEQQAELTALPFSGGSLRSVVYYSELERIRVRTRSRFIART